MANASEGMPACLQFAPQRRGALNSYEICFADQKRAQGVGWQNIANMLRRHVDDVRRYCEPQAEQEAALRPVAKTVTPADRNETFKELWLAGASTFVITQRTGIPPNSFYALRKRLGLPGRGIAG